MSGSHVDDDFLDSDVDLTQSRSVRLARATERPAPYLMLVLERHRLLAAGARYPLVNIDEVVVGRGRVRAATRERDGERRRLTIRVPDPQASTTHARILRSDGGWTVEDAQSKNGTVVNGEPATVTRLGDGDVIEIGQTFFMFRDAVPSAVGDAIDLDAAQLKPQAPGLGTLVPPLARRFDALAQVARASVAVLVRGETGTGKELVARAVHALSGRRGDFVPVNCGGIPETLLESELFGHMKGSFTGAGQTRAGFFQTADGGTIFLDEISETSAAMQVKLLRSLNDKEVYMVGATKPQKVDIRIVAATNKDLADLVRRNLFREDLFFRLNVIPIRIPPLRERGDDILLLIHHFAARFAADAEKPVPRFSDGALSALRGYHWPGNVRELENVIQRLVVMGEGDTLDVVDLPELMRFSALRGSGLHRTLAEVEVEHIRLVLQSVDGNKTRAASILGIDRKTLREKLKNYNLEA